MKKLPGLMLAMAAFLPLCPFAMATASTPFAEPGAPPPPPPPPPPGQGFAHLRCSASSAGALSDCVATHEFPEGLGVAAAAVKKLIGEGAPAGVSIASGVYEADVLVPLTPEQQAAWRPPAVYTMADWLIKPTLQQAMAAFPAKARRAKQQGHVMLSCRVAISGEVQDCAVQLESPKDYGFGQAALSLTRWMRFKPKLSNNVPVAGTAMIPVDFRPRAYSF